MERLKVSTTVHVPPREAFEFLVDFPRYAAYSEYLDDVTQYGDGEVGTEYDLTFKWWKLTYTVRSQVTDIEENERIDWAVQDRLAAQGYWRIEPTDPPSNETVATKVWFVAEYDPASMTWDLVNVPALVSTDWILDRVKPLLVDEAKRVVGRVVADLEGGTRPVELTIHERPD